MAVSMWTEIEVLIYVEGLGEYLIETRIFVRLLCSYVTLVEGFLETWHDYAELCCISFVVFQLLLQFGC
jgi:hypothetical protein